MRSPRGRGKRRRTPSNFPLFLSRQANAKRTRAVRFFACPRQNDSAALRAFFQACDKTIPAPCGQFFARPAGAFGAHVRRDQQVARRPDGRAFSRFSKTNLYVYFTGTPLPARLRRVCFLLCEYFVKICRTKFEKGPPNSCLFFIFTYNMYCLFKITKLKV